MLLPLEKAHRCVETGGQDEPLRTWLQLRVSIVL